MNTPNLLTILRILLIPIFIILYLEPTSNRSLAAALVFAFAAITDWLDGYLARSRGQITKLGKLLDPIADKLLTITGLVLLVGHQKVAVWIVILLISREVAVTGLRAIAASSGTIIQADLLGKQKMLFLTGAIMLLILDYNGMGTALIWMSLFFSLLSGIQYFIKFWKKIVL
ncbi:MAG: CDP-diacylglycerol--glycerol-3-phosphate 3-phosphatidyltransferase [Nitrospirae bacterium]|nr:CDP-diacylglycerol--glycerol-3-phosphate 3-phosphatidyltransferase [Nitrospirota bacterium]